MKFIKEFTKGVFIGAGAILPGISSGVLCVIFGIYETLLDCVLNFFRDFKRNFKILFPIACGVICGILIFGNILKYIFYAYPVQTKFTFIGLILGSIPSLFKKACTKQTFKFRYLIYLLISFFIGLTLVFFERNIHSEVSFQNDYSPLYIAMSGFFMSIGIIVPGISSTLILLLLGIYDAYLFSISNFYLPFLIPLVLGVGIRIFYMYETCKISI